MADCKECEGKGVIPFFTSLAECETCKGWGITGALTNKEKQNIAEFIKTPEGRRKLAASLTQPIRRRRDHNSITRKTFREKMTA